MKLRKKVASLRPKATRPAKSTTRPKPGLGRGKGKITLHGNFMSMPSAKVGLLLSMASAYRHVDLSQGAQRRPEYLELNRFGQVPVLQHGDVTLAQSNVILEYLADMLGQFGGATEEERRDIAEWLDWEADLVSSGLRAARGMVRFQKPDPAVIQHAKARAERALQLLNEVLADREYLVGDSPTIADLAILPHISVAEEAEIDLAPYANVRNWLARIMALPGAGHPYDVMPKEDRDQL
ncbi:MAG TPA: glutathione S-transferase family protein [Methylomirabilota bacterium]|nr:glutathione S-transferase family protein [Methylomirabilota bacterium]